MWRGQIPRPSSTGLRWGQKWSNLPSELKCRSATSDYVWSICNMVSYAVILRIRQIRKSQSCFSRLHCHSIEEIHYTVFSRKLHTLYVCNRKRNVSAFTELSVWTHSYCTVLTQKGSIENAAKSEKSPTDVGGRAWSIGKLEPMSSLRLCA